MTITVVNSTSEDEGCSVSKKVEDLTNFVKRQPKWLRGIWGIQPRRRNDIHHADELILTNIAV